MPDYKYYIAYGSNLNIRQMHQRCPDARIAGTSELTDWQLMFKGSKTGSYLTIEPKAGFTVPVAVWKVSKEDEKSLDTYEGYPSFYYKKKLRITVKGIKTGTLRERTAFVYIMHENRPFGIPSELYMSVCAEGYHSFHFDTNTLEDAYYYSKEKCTE